MVFDKVATLTKGKLTVVQQWYTDGDQGATKSLLLGLVVGTIKHPVSGTVASHLRNSRVSPAPVLKQTTVPSKGLESVAQASGIKLGAGNCHWFSLAFNPIVGTVLS